MCDIAKCPNEDCPVKTECYRYTALPHPYWQSYMDFRPDENGLCMDYMPVYDKTKIITTKDLTK